MYFCISDLETVALCGTSTQPLNAVVRWTREVRCSRMLTLKCMFRTLSLVIRLSLLCRMVLSRENVGWPYNSGTSRVVFENSRTDQAAGATGGKVCFMSARVRHPLGKPLERVFCRSYLIKRLRGPQGPRRAAFGYASVAVAKKNISPNLE